MNRSDLPKSPFSHARDEIDAARAEELGLGADRIVISAKVSAVQDLISVYTLLAQRSNYALHLGLTEAGMGTRGIVWSASAMALSMSAFTVFTWARTSQVN